MRACSWMDAFGTRTLQSTHLDGPCCRLNSVACATRTYPRSFRVEALGQRRTGRRPVVAEPIAIANRTSRCFRALLGRLRLVLLPVELSLFHCQTWGTPLDCSSTGILIEKNKTVYGRLDRMAHWARWQSYIVIHAQRCSRAVPSPPPVRASI